jgi:8-oxo-dGTP pyrophosphatase MutT (NUDIX family)
MPAVAAKPHAHAAGSSRLGGVYRFNDDFRHEVARRCAAFSRRSPAAAAEGLRPAAVAIVLVAMPDAAETALLLTRRVEALRAHSGQWALPGGRCDTGESAIAAALRELDEELGLRLAPDQVIGMLDDYPTRSGYLITPVVAWAGPDITLRPNPDEVASVHHVALSDIARPEVVEFFRIPESERTGVRMHIHGNHVYAPTAAVIYQFREVLAGRDTRVADFEQPVFAWR